MGALKILNGGESLECLEFPEFFFLFLQFSIIRIWLTTRFFPGWPETRYELKLTQAPHTSELNQKATCGFGLIVISQIFDRVKFKFISVNLNNVFKWKRINENLFLLYLLSLSPVMKLPISFYLMKMMN